MQHRIDQRPPRPATRAGAHRDPHEHAAQRALVVASLISCPKNDARRP
jgi:hypothetical protein